MLLCSPAPPIFVMAFLTLALLALVPFYCTGQLIDCVQNVGQQHCVCFQLDAAATFRRCSVDPNLDYSDFGVRVLQAGSFQHLDNVLSLNLSHNAPPELSINSLSFVGLTSLTVLYLQGNGLSVLPDGLFSPMTSLETLYLQSNNLSELNSKAFKNVSSLKTLYVDDNRLTQIPPDLLENLPSLVTISLGSNSWDCSGSNVDILVDLVHSGMVQNGDQLTCANSSLVSDIIIERPTMTSSSITTMSSSITPSYTSSTPSITPTSQPSSSILQPTPTSSSITPSYTSLIIPISQPSSSILQPTPTSLPRMLCSQLENYATMYGFLDWPETPVGQTSMQDCPHGPEGGVVSRECGEGGKWEDFEGSGCDPATDTIQLLINISQMKLSLSNIESVSSSLSSALSTSTSLSLDELEVVLDIADQLITFSGASITVLNNSLQAVDYLLSYSGESLVEGGSEITDRLRAIIDTALLSSLSTNNTNLVLMFPHLAVGGVYISGTNHTHILAVISVGGEGEGGLVIGEEEGAGEGEGEGEEEEGGDVEVEIDGDIEGPVQVTVYNDSSLFNTTSCGSNVGIQGDNDLAPVISVTDQATDGSETITITYHVGEVDDVTCVRWNSSFNCGRGGWQAEGCQLMKGTANFEIICVCMNKGTFGLLDTQDSCLESDGNDNTVAVVEYVFYSCCVLAAALYLPVIIAVLCNKSLRVLPLKQCVAHVALSQAFSLLVLAASYHPHSPHQLCYTLAVLLHYSLLVALAWLVSYPIMATLKVFRRTWFEKRWLLLPVAGACWILPAVVVGGVGASRYEGATHSPDLCWSEADVFPNYFTYLSGLVMVLTLLITSVVIPFLCCSDYDLELPVHLRIASNQINALLYSTTVVCVYLTADSVSHGSKYQLNTDYLLVLTGILALSSAGYFLVANGWGNSRIRRVLLCREDPALKRKVGHYQELMTNTLTSQASSRTSEHRNARRNGTRITDEMNLNYVNSYLGYNDVSSSHVPLDMFGHMDRHGGGGRRVRDRRSGEPMGGPTGFRNVGFKVPHATSMV